jgi:hypothetical protein
MFEFNVQPLSTTLEVIKNFGIIWKKQDNELVILVEKEKAKSLKEYNKIKLNFLIYIKDDYLLTYTDGNWENILGQVFLFTNSKIAAKDNSKNYLHRAGFVTPADLRQWPVKLRYPPKPTACVSIRLGSFLQSEYTISFKTSSKYWVYYFVSDYAFLKEVKNLTIICSDNTILFQSVNEVVLPNGRKAFSIRSSQPIPLLQRQTIKFSLISKSDQGDKYKLIISQLPYPNFNSFSNVIKVLGNGTNKNTLEIFL